jgi:aquaporin Z
MSLDVINSKAGGGREALRTHWPEYASEAGLLALFMIAACGFGIVIQHPDSPAASLTYSPLLRRFLMGLAMGLTSIALVYSPIGQRSGAHMNPAMTLAFWRLGKIRTWDAAFYVIAQFIGGIAGVGLMMYLANRWAMHSSVNFVATLPGSISVRVLIAAWIAEFDIAGVLMLVVLMASNRVALARFTPLFAGSLVMLYITFEAPVSGMSMNPARTFGSAFWAHAWTGLWIYFTAPPLAMLLASRIYMRLPGIKYVYCAKMHHFNNKRCIFNCEFSKLNYEPTIHKSFSDVSHPSAERTSVLQHGGTSVKPSALDMHLNQRTLFYG